MSGHNQNSVVVIGGGWAGLAAATKLVESDWKVTLLERAKTLGGRASSFSDDIFGESLDNGPHLFIGAYHTSLDMLKTWNAFDGIQFDIKQQIPWIYPDGKMIKLNIGGGKASSAMGLMTFRGMSIVDRIRSVIAIKALVEMPLSGSSSLDNLTVAQYLSRFGIKPKSCGGFWDMLTVAVMNVPTDIAAIKPLIRALNQGFLMGGDAGRIGLTTKPFQQLYCDPAEQYLVQNGATIYKGASVKKIIIDSSGRLAGVSLQSGDVIHANAVVIATLPHDVIKLLPDNENTAPLNSQLSQFKYSPITAVHINFSKPVMTIPFAALPNSLSQWVFKRGEADKDGYSKVSIVISSSPPKTEMSTAQIEKQIVSELRQRLKTDASVTFIRTIRTARATIVLTPEAEMMRPQVTTQIKGFYIAGDWCDTGLPATIESAAISGIQAAEEVIKQ